ncbi:hypothetical protein MPTK1_8g04050 [Marchantia polymorpha subsp. ruderalis]|uniref:Uncharacterized protein n=1 Tax=Marchantia polymorpha TaxID=3197 RepID=A0A2R6XJL9_MARPO|nr:hypothetical protein MARPO_0012s0194 [Marchantia polymorpha]BBN18625.1 hypothetical protein Mp_8g04050 [Marchantia polymorpha subsp. ruderalis]|eukprot:PTQ46272.1 hypothetical protein MARPO_0012s0194 [Marchantia polymorpha]
MSLKALLFILYYIINNFRAWSFPLHQYGSITCFGALRHPISDPFSESTIVRFSALVQHEDSIITF